MNIALCTDDKYAKYCMVTIISVLESNSKENCTIYVLTDYLNDTNRDLFVYLSNYYKQPIKIIEIPSDSFSQLKVCSRYPRSMYYRFLLPSIIYDNKVLYLDCDIINRKSLSSFYSMDLEGIAAAVIEDAQGDDVLLHNRIRYSGKYFNSGVLLMNLDYWRQNSISQQLVDFIEHNPDRCFYPDQDALNIVLEGKVIFAPYSYNCQQPWYTSLDKILFSYTKWEQVQNIINDPAIVHYTATNKPWFKECEHPHVDWFLMYALKHKELGFQVYNRLPRFRAMISNIIEYIIYRLQNSNLVIKRK